MNLKEKNLNIFKVVMPVGQLRDEDSRPLKRALVSIIQSGERNLVINLNEVSLMTSHALGVLVYAWKKMGEVRGNLHIICGRDNIREIFKYTNLQSIIKMYKDEDEFIIGEVLSNVRSNGKYRIIDLTDRFNVAGDVDYLEKLIKMLMAKRHFFIVINMENIEHVYSRVLGVFIKWHKKLKNENGQFCLINVNDHLLNIMQHVKIDKFMYMYSSEEDLPV